MFYDSQMYQVNKERYAEALKEAENYRMIQRAKKAKAPVVQSKLRQAFAAVVRSVGNGLLRASSLIDGDGAEGPLVVHPNGCQ